MTIDFHFAIAQCSRNPMLINLLCGELYPLLRLYRGPLIGTRPRGRRAIMEHERVVSAIEDHDPDLAETMMRRHISAARMRRQSGTGYDTVTVGWHGLHRAPHVQLCDAQRRVEHVQQPGGEVPCAT